jgi:hypothetical protein
MRFARIFPMLAVALAAGLMVMPRHAEDLPTESVTAAMQPAGELSCEQVLYLEEVELLSGSACG